MLFVPLVVVNALIAMMAETYSRVIGQSFMNYIFAFGKVLVEYRYAPVVLPFNLLTVPYVMGSNLMLLLGIIKSIIRPTGKRIHQKVPPPRNGEMGLEVDRIRFEILKSETKKNQCEKAVARFCKAQDEQTDPPSLEEIRDIVKESMKDQSIEMQELFRLEREHDRAQLRKLIREEVQRKG